MKKLIIISMLLQAACGKNSSNGFNGNGLTTAVYTQESGFIDVQICGIDVHTVNGKVLVCGGNAFSQTSNTGYTQGTDGYYTFPNGGPQGQSCYFKIVGGAFDPNATAP